MRRISGGLKAMTWNEKVAILSRKYGLDVKDV